MSETEDYIRQHFRRQGDACERLGSPFNAMLCRILADNLDETTKVGHKILTWPGTAGDDALALRLCGGLHVLVLSDADPKLAALYPPHLSDWERLRLILPEILTRNEEALLQALQSAPQTNEIARSGMLLPGFLAIARETGLPLSLHEIGSSAGLNLLFDLFHYSMGNAAWGDANSPVQLSPEVRGQVPPLDGELQILSRYGSDISPIEVENDKDRLRLRSYVWPDQALRLERLDAALGLGLKTLFSVVKSDAEAFVHNMLSDRKPNVATVLFHSIMWQYMPENTRAAIVSAMEAAGAEATEKAPLAWLRMEPLVISDPHATLSLTLWPNGETRHLAKCDYHGRWIEWF
ncbi:DUF2332 family protein [Mesorhizobium sp. SB112]|uniref:DUF2332 domain-containing protein n=1 Tax=Mesorhizobium sp. SB112 TaxID=3151853 RepID=UPI0032635E5C